MRKVKEVLLFIIFLPVALCMNRKRPFFRP